MWLFFLGGYLLEEARAARWGLTTPCNERGTKSPIWVLNLGQSGAYLKHEKPDAFSTDGVNPVTALLENRCGNRAKSP